MDDTPKTPSQSAAANPRRRWLRFGLRSLLIAVAFLSICLGIAVNRANRQRRAVATILRAGGEVAYDYETDKGGSASGHDAVPPGPAWLRNLIGVDYFATVVGVSIDGEKGGAESACAAIQQLPGLECVSFEGVRLTTPMMDYLRGATRLETLNISFCQVGGADWKALEHLTRLKTLELRGSGVDDATLSHFKGLTSLENLEISSCDVTNAGLDHLDALPRLESVDLSECKKIADLGITAHFKKLSHLKSVNIHGTSVTVPGVDELERAMPDLHIDGPWW